MIEELDKIELACFIRCSSDKSLYNRYIKLYKKIAEQNKKIERLNNIIRGLEKKLIDDMLFIDEYTAGSYDHCVETINKLQELKRKKDKEWRK